MGKISFGKPNVKLEHLLETKKKKNTTPVVFTEETLNCLYRGTLFDCLLLEIALTLSNLCWKFRCDSNPTSGPYFIYGTFKDLKMLFETYSLKKKHYLNYKLFGHNLSSVFFTEQRIFQFAFKHTTHASVILSARGIRIAPLVCIVHESRHIICIYLIIKTNE